MSMKSSFEPSFKNFDRDIEKYLVSLGKFRKLKNGMMEFRGYNKAQAHLFSVYLENRAYDPLISNLRYWNWEVGDNRFLEELTDRLVEAGDWPRLKKLWGSVLSKRRRLFNQMVVVRRKDAEAIPPRSFSDAEVLLLGTIDRLLAMAGKYGKSDEIDIYSRMAERVRRGLKA